MTQPRSSERQGQPSLRSAALVASVPLVLTGLVILRDAWLGSPLIPSPWFVATIIGTGFGVALYAHVFVQIRGQRIQFAFTEIPFAFGLAYLSPWLLAASWALAATATSIIRHGSNWYKLVFNSAMIVLRVAIADAIVRALTTELNTLKGAAALMTAIAIAETVGSLLNAAFLRRMSDSNDSKLLIDVLGSTSQSVVGASMGTWALIAAFAEPGFLILPAIAMGLIWQLSKQQIADRLAYQDLLEIHGFLETMAGIEPSDVVREGLLALRSGLNSTWAALADDTGTVIESTGLEPNAAEGNGIEESQAAHRFRMADGRMVLLGPGIHAASRKTHGARFTAAMDLFESAITRADLQIKLDYDATHDPLTGLLARRGFMREVDKELVRLKGAGIVLIVDLSRFGDVNKTLGFRAGDLLLVEAARRIEESLDSPAIVARLNADSFAIFLPTGDQRHGLDVAARVRAALGRPLDVEGLALSPLSKVGLAVGPIHGKSTEQLLRAADVASDLARHAQPPIVVYRVESDIHSESRLELLTRLGRALDDEGLEVWFQPKVDAISGLVVGAEALLRWQDQDRWIPPDLFIPAAEAAGMMNELTDFVVRRSLAAVAKWRANGHSLGVAVNLSPSSLEDAQLPARIASELRRFQIDPPSLTIEITESVVMGLGQTVSDGLSRLRSLGVRISVDDFGTGYSSLRYLKDLNIDELKLDRSFVQDLSVSDRSATIARAVIGLGHNLGLQVVAEGVETVEARDLLNEMSCDVLQGFLVARPMDETKLERWLDRHQTKQIRPDRPAGITRTGPAK